MIADSGGKSPQLDASCFVADGAHVLGDVSAGKLSSIWFNAVVRGDIGWIRIGSRTNIQDLCVLHTDLGEGLEIGDDVTVGHRAILHGCIIGDRVLVGMGAIIMNGAKIGDECIIGAGAIVTEGTQIPPRSMVLGVPGKIKRGITQEEAEQLARHAEDYAQFAERYQKKRGACG